MVRVGCYSYAVINRLKMYIYTYTYASILLMPIFNVVNAGLYLLGLGVYPLHEMADPLVKSKNGVDCLWWIPRFFFVQKLRWL